MVKDRGRNDARASIAHLAARLMAEDGIEDYGLAKRKAARQAGAHDLRQLPTNDEIDAALHAYQQLYRSHEHREHLRELRGKAINAMRQLARFNPYLTGSVLNGNAGKYADIDLQLFTDDVKAVEHYLIDRGIPYTTKQSKLYSGGCLRVFPVFCLNEDGIEILLTVLATHELRGPLRTHVGGKVIERAKLIAVERLVAET